MSGKILMVIPTLGRRNVLLRQTLTSIRGQDVQADVVVVSPDSAGVRDLVREFGARFVPDPGRGGQSGALNAGLDAAAPDAEYFAWLCDDDVLTTDSLRLAHEALERDPLASMVYGWCDYVDEQGAVVFSSRAGRLADRILPWGPNLIPQPGSLMRLSHVREVGGVNEDCRLTMDLDLFLRLRKQGPILSLPRTQAHFRWHSDSLTVSQETASMDEADRVRQSHMSPAGAAAYTVLRWPGRWALRLAKRRVQRNTRRLATRRPQSDAAS